MKKVLFLAMNLGSGGAERQMVTIACLLKTRGFDVSFVCYEEGDFYLDQLQRNGINVTWQIKKGIYRLLSFRRFIREGRYDVVISFLETPNILNCFAAYGTHHWKVVVGERSSKTEHMTSRRGRITAFLMKKCDFLVCNSNNAANMWSNYHPEFKERIRVIYNLVNINRDEISTLKNHNFLTKERIRIVVAASYQYLKNPINVIRALLLLTEEERSKIEIFWFGNPSVKPSAYKESITLVLDNHLEDCVKLQQPIKDIHTQMSLANYVGLFSSVEGLPNAICEAMMIGRPIIMSKVSDYKTLVNNNGFLCDGNDPESIADTFRKIINTDVNQEEMMGVESRKIAELLFSKEIILRQWESILL